MFTKNYLGTAPTFAWTNPSSFFLSVWKLKALVYSVAIENEETLHQSVFRPVRLLATTQVPMKVCDSPRSDVSTCALIAVQNILSIPCEW